MDSKKVKRSTAPLRWKKLDTVGSDHNSPYHIPTSRLGHTFTLVGTNGFVFGGLVTSDYLQDNTHRKKDVLENAVVSDEMFQIKLNSSKGPFEWIKLKTTFRNGSGSSSSTCSSIPPRYFHTTSYVNKRLVVFAGIPNDSNNTRLNDMWIFNPITMDWSQPKSSSSNQNEGNNNDNDDDTVLFTPRGTPIRKIKNTSVTKPCARGGHSAAVYEERTIYYFGGYGGSGKHSRRDLNDLYSYDVFTDTFTLIKFTGTPPKPRSSHKSTIIESSLFIFGGYSTSTYFNDLHVFNILTSNWSSIDLKVFQSPTANMTAVSVVAIPYHKLFIFGGYYHNNESLIKEDEDDESALEISDTVDILDVKINSDSAAVSVTSAMSVHTGYHVADGTMVFDAKRARLVCFGGWKFNKNVYSLDISTSVGPVYNVSSIHPASGSILGGTPLVITGNDFPNTNQDTNVIHVRFEVVGNSNTSVITVSSTESDVRMIDSQSIALESPNFYSAGNNSTLSVQVRVAFGAIDAFYTSTFVSYEFIAITSGPHCFTLISPGVVGGRDNAILPVTTVPALIVIQACDIDSVPRTTGGDVFDVSIEYEKKNSIAVDTIVDNNDGTYDVLYTVPHNNASNETTTVVVSIECQNKLQGGHIRGSPFSLVTFSNPTALTTNSNYNLMDGVVVKSAIEDEINKLSTYVTSVIDGLTSPGDTISTSRDALIGVKQLLLDISAAAESVNTTFRRIEATFRRIKNVASSQRTQVRMLQREWSDKIQSSLVPLMNLKVAPLMKEQMSAVRKELGEYYNTLDKEYYAKVVGYEEDENFDLVYKNPESDPQDAITSLSSAIMEDHHEQLVLFSKMEYLATIFDSKELVTGPKSLLDESLSVLVSYETTWTSILELFNIKESLSLYNWKSVTGISIRMEDIKNFRDKVESVETTIAECDIESSSSSNAVYERYKRDYAELSSTVAILELLRPDFIYTRHWNELQTYCSEEDQFVDFDSRSNAAVSIRDILLLRLYRIPKIVSAVSTRAAIEIKQEMILKDVSSRWIQQEEDENDLIKYEELQDDESSFAISQDIRLTLAQDITLLKSHSNNVYKSFYQSAFEDLYGSLMSLEESLVTLNQILQMDLYLRPLYRDTEQVGLALPEVTETYLSSVMPRIDTLCTTLSGSAVYGSFDSSNEDLKEIYNALESCHKSLKTYLDQIKGRFPRFYFISNKTLLDIITTDGDTAVNGGHQNENVYQVFPLITSLNLNPEKCQICSLTCDSETLVMSPEIKTKDIEFDAFYEALRQGIQSCLIDNVLASLELYPTLQRSTWALTSKENHTPFQCIELVASINFTTSVENAIKQRIGGNYTALTDLLGMVAFYIVDLCGNLRSDTTLVISNLLMNDLKRRDVVNDIVTQSNRGENVSLTSFVWQSQLRYYLKKKGRVAIEVGFNTFSYGYEYHHHHHATNALSSDRNSYLRITEAVRLYYGSRLNKSSIIAESLAHEMGKFFIATESTDVNVVASIISGVVVMGGWGAVSVGLNTKDFTIVYEMLRNVIKALRNDKDRVVINQDHDVKLNPTVHLSLVCGSGSNDTVDTSSYFRPVSHTISNSSSTRITYALQSLGIELGLALKIVTFFKSLPAILSSTDAQDSTRHFMSEYRYEEEEQEEDGGDDDNTEYRIVHTIKRIYHNRLRDASTVDSLLYDIFKVKDEDDSDTTTTTIQSRCIEDACGDLKYWPDVAFRAYVSRVVTCLRHWNRMIIVGDVGTGKSAILETAATASNIITEFHKLPGDVPEIVHMSMRDITLDDKTCTLILFIKSIVDSDKEYWIVIEDEDCYLYSSLCLWATEGIMTLRGSNLKMFFPSNVKLVFEVLDTSTWDPALLSSMAVVSVHNSTISTNNDNASLVMWQCQVASYVASITTSVPVRTELSRLVLKYVPSVATFCYETLTNNESPPINSCVSTVIALLEAFIDDHVTSVVENEFDNVLDRIFCFALIWGFGSCLSVEGRNEFSKWWQAVLYDSPVVTFIVEESSSSSNEQLSSVFSIKINPETLEYQDWKDDFRKQTSRRNNSNTSITGGDELFQMIVPTIEECQFVTIGSLISLKNIALVGARYSGKTTAIRALMRENESSTSSTKTEWVHNTPLITRKVLKKYLVKEEGLLRPFNSDYEKLLLVVEDVNLNKSSEFQSSLDTGYIWNDAGEQEFMPSRDVMSYVITTSETTSRRLLRHFHVFQWGFVSRQSVYDITHDVLMYHMACICSFDSVMSSVVPELAKATVEVLSFTKSSTLIPLILLLKGMLFVRNTSFYDTIGDIVNLWSHHVLLKLDISLKKLKKLTKPFFTIQEPLVDFYCHQESGNYVAIPDVEKLRLDLKKIDKSNNDLVLILNPTVRVIADLSRVVHMTDGHVITANDESNNNVTVVMSYVTLLGKFISYKVVCSLLLSPVLLDTIEVELLLHSETKDEGVLLVVEDLSKECQQWLRNPDATLLAMFFNTKLSADVASRVNTVCSTITDVLKSSNVIPSTENVVAYWARVCRKRVHFVLCRDSNNDVTLFQQVSLERQEDDSEEGDFYHIVSREVITSSLEDYMDDINSSTASGTEGILSEHTVVESVIALCATVNQDVVVDDNIYTTFVKSFTKIYKSIYDGLTSKLDDYVKATARVEAIDDMLRYVYDDLEFHQSTLEKKQALATDIHDIISTQRLVLRKHEKKVSEVSNRMEKLDKSIVQKKAIVTSELKKTLPIRQRILNAIDTIDLKDIGKLKNKSKLMTNDLVNVYASLITLFSGSKDEFIHDDIKKSVKDSEKVQWSFIKATLLANVASFFTSLKHYIEIIDANTSPNLIKENISNTRPYLYLDSFDVRVIEKVDNSSAGLVLYIKEIIEYYDAMQFVYPKQDDVKKLEKEKVTLSEEAFEIELYRDRALRKLQELEKEASTIKQDLVKATNDVNGAKERTRLADDIRKTLGTREQIEEWTTSISRISDSRLYVLGDSLLLAYYVVIACCCSYKYEDRKKMLKEFQDLVSHYGKLRFDDIYHNIPCSEDFVIERYCEFLYSEILPNTSDWIVGGKLYYEMKENALVTDFISKSLGLVPIVLDTEGVATSWLKYVSTSYIITACDNNSTTWVTSVMAAMESGSTVTLHMLTNIDDSLRMLEPVLAKRTFVEDETNTYLMWQNRKCKYNSNFRLLIHCTTASNSNSLLQVEWSVLASTRVCSEVLLRDVLYPVTNPILSTLANNCYDTLNSINRTLNNVSVADKIVRIIASYEGDITTDASLIKTVANIQSSGTDNAVKYKTLRGCVSKVIGKDECELIFRYYVPLANSLTKVFEWIDNRISFNLFKKVISESLLRLLPSFFEIVPTPAEGLQNISTFEKCMEMLNGDLIYFTYGIYKEDPKKSFDTAIKKIYEDSYQYMLLRVCDSSDIVTKLLVNLYIKSNVSRVDHESASVVLKLDAFKYITSGGGEEFTGVLTTWMNKQTFERLLYIQDCEFEIVQDVFPNNSLILFIEHKSDAWQQWYEDEEEDNPPPLPKPTVLNEPFRPLLILLITRAFFPEKSLNLVRNYVRTRMGKNYITSPTLFADIIPAVVKLSTLSVPVIIKSKDVVKKYHKVYSVERFNGLEENEPLMILVEINSINTIESVLRAWKKSVDDNTIHEDARLFMLRTDSDGDDKNLLKDCMVVSYKPSSSSSSAQKRIQDDVLDKWNLNFSASLISSCSKPQEYQGCLYIATLLSAVLFHRQKYLVNQSHKTAVEEWYFTTIADVFSKILDPAVVTDIPYRDIGAYMVSLYNEEEDKTLMLCFKALSRLCLSEKVLVGNTAGLVFPPGMFPDAFVYTFSKYVSLLSHEECYINESASLVGLSSWISGYDNAYMTRCSKALIRSLQQQEQQQQEQQHPTNTTSTKGKRRIKVEEEIDIEMINHVIMQSSNTATTTTLSIMDFVLEEAKDFNCKLKSFNERLVSDSEITAEEKAFVKSRRSLINEWSTKLSSNSVVLPINVPIDLTLVSNVQRLVLALRRSTARILKGQYELQNTVVRVEFLKTTSTSVGLVTNTNTKMHVTGLYIQGAHYDEKRQVLVDKKSGVSRFELLPIACLSAEIAPEGDEEGDGDFYKCPVYKKNSSSPLFYALIGVKVGDDDDDTEQQNLEEKVVVDSKSLIDKWTINEVSIVIGVL